MSNVIAFPAREVSAFDEAWALVPITMRKRSKKMAILREGWERHAGDFGQRKLLAALRAYVTEKDFDRHGGQALDRWLSGGRYEHFVEEASRPAAQQFTDLMVRRVVVTRLGEEFARLYLDPCEVDGKVLVVRTGYAVNKLKQHSELFKSLGFVAMRRLVPQQEKNHVSS